MKKCNKFTSLIVMRKKVWHLPREQRLFLTSTVPPLIPPPFLINNLCTDVIINVTTRVPRTRVLLYGQRPLLPCVVWNICLWKMLTRLILAWLLVVWNDYPCVDQETRDVRWCARIAMCRARAYNFSDTKRVYVKYYSLFYESIVK